MLCYMCTVACIIVIPAPDKAVCCNPGRENESRSRMILEDLENLAPSPLIFILIGCSDLIAVGSFAICNNKNVNKCCS